MNYCSLEEAWGSTYGKQNKKKKVKNYIIQKFLIIFMTKVFRGRS